ncbi:MAG: S9 family peptidase [Planctomycetes bacterium]|nr:S9 family peptidase [Planctomycetota bacterium]
MFDRINRRRTVGHGWRDAVVMAAMLIAAPLSASRVSAGDEVFTPKHIAKVRSVTSAVISPDGAHIAYTVSVPRRLMSDDNGPAWSELHVVDMSGKSRPFVTGEVTVSAVDWTPDGTGISFLAKRGDDEHKSLYVIPIAGGEARNVLSHDTDLARYSWGPDGREVAFTAKEERSKKHKKLEKKGFNQEVFEEDRLFTRIWIGAPDDEDQEPRMLEIEGNVNGLSWSPVEGLIAVAIAPTPLIDDSYMRTRLSIVDAITGSIVARIENPGKLGQYEWSPDGERLAVVSAEALDDPSPGRLTVVSKAGGKLIDILPGYLGHVSSVAWQSNDTIMYLGDMGVWTTFAEIGRDGTRRKTHIEVGGNVLYGLTLSRDGQSVSMRSDSPTHPAEVFAMSHGDTKPRRLSDVNPWFSDMRFAKQEPITHDARDGLKLEGLLIHPLDEQPGQRYPLILSVHGGPEAHQRQGWLNRPTQPGQVAAASGYAVFYPNYRASTGRGVEFSKLDRGDPAGKEFDDLVDAVDHLINIGLVDRDKVGVTGGSYGGYASAWCATYYTERFAAAVMNVGITNSVSKLGNTDIPDEMYLVHYGKRLWEDWDLYRSRSPIYYVQQARTPLLIMHGKDDTRVNPEQSLQLHRHLKTIGKVPVRHIRYPGEGHGNRKAAARYDYQLRMMRWFDHFLKGPGGELPPVEIDYDIEDEDEGDDEDDDGDED